MVNNGTNQTPKQNSANCGSIDESERAFGATERAQNFSKEREKMLKPWWKKPMEVEIPMLR